MACQNNASQMSSTNLKPKDANPPGIFNRLSSLLKRHLQVLGYVLTVILAIIVKTRRRPVLFSRYGGMGDIICIIPATRALLERHLGHVVIYNCHASFTEIPRLAGLASIVTNLGPIGLVGYWYAPLLAGYYHFTHGDDLPDSGCQEPMVTKFCKQFKLPSVEEHPELTAPESVRLKVRQVLAAHGLSADSLILIHPGPSWPVREWPRENWQQLIAPLRPPGPFLFCPLGVEDRRRKTWPQAWRQSVRRGCSRVNWAGPRLTGVEGIQAGGIMAINHLHR